MKHFKLRIRDHCLRTAANENYIGFMYNIHVNMELNHTHSSLVLNRGTEYMKQRQDNTREVIETALPMDAGEARKRVRELSAWTQVGSGVTNERIYDECLYVHPCVHMSTWSVYMMNVSMLMHVSTWSVCIK